MVKYDLGDLEIFGENLYAIRSIAYRKLEHHFYVFGIREHNRWLSWEEMQFYANMLELPTVPLVKTEAAPQDRQLFESELLALVKGPGAFESYDVATTMESIVTRNANGCPVDAFAQNVFKYVRKRHVKTDEHWTPHLEKGTIIK